MSDATPTLTWETQAFPEARLATLVVEKPVAILSRLFGVWDTDIEENYPGFPETTTYDGLFKHAQEIIVDQIASLLARATDSINLFPGGEARTRATELARIDAQQATLHCIQELWYHAACRDDPQADELLRNWEPEKPWDFLELAKAIKDEGTAKSWERIESTLTPDPPTPGGPRSRLMGIPLRSVLPQQARRHPFAEADWFTKRATAATVGTKANRRKRARARAVERSTRPSGLVEGTQGNPTEPHDDDGSASELDPSIGEGRPDRLDPEPDFKIHPNRWRLWVMRQERRRAESMSAHRPEPREATDRRAPVKTQPIKHYKGQKGDEGDLERFLRALKAHFKLTRIDGDMDRILTAGMLLEGRAGEWYGAYLCKIDPDEAQRVHGRRVDLDPAYKSWRKFEASLRDSFGGRTDRFACLKEWQALRQTGSIDEFLDEVDRLMWIIDYKDDVVKDKLRLGLASELGREWSKVSPKPDTVGAQMALLREMGHTAEDYDRIEGRQKGRDRDSGKHRSDRDRDRAPRSDNDRRSGTDKPRKGNPSGRKDRESSKPTPLRDEALKGISADTVAQRQKDRVCLKCGRSGHRWSDCYAKDQVSEKRKESSGDSSSSASKKFKAAAVARSDRGDTESADEGGRIMEVPEDEQDSDYEMWAR
jgi:hypothetical protein